MANRLFDLGDVISLVGGNGEKFIVVGDIPGMGVYVHRIIGGDPRMLAEVIPNNDNYMKVGSWDFIENVEVDDEVQ